MCWIKISILKRIKTNFSFRILLVFAHNRDRTHVLQDTELRRNLMYTLMQYSWEITNTLNKQDVIMACYWKFYTITLKYGRKSSERCDDSINIVLGNHNILCCEYWCRERKCVGDKKTSRKYLTMLTVKISSNLRVGLHSSIIISPQALIKVYLEHFTN